MQMRVWLPRYRRIASLLGLSVERDREATLKLAGLVRGKTIPLREVRRRVKGRTVAVFGAGPSLPKDLERLAQANLLGLLTPIGADGATSALLLYGVTPSLVVSDLDGRLEDLLKAERRGSILVVHGHGDNMEKLEGFLSKAGRILATTQVQPVRRLVHNFGGFTDGDRAAFLAEAFGAERVILAGMDLGRMVGKYSKPGLRGDVEASAGKQLKLRIAGELLSWLAGWARAEILNFTFKGEDIPGVSRVSLSELRRLLRA